MNDFNNYSVQEKEMLIIHLIQDDDDIRMFKLLNDDPSYINKIIGQLMFSGNTIIMYAFHTKSFNVIRKLLDMSTINVNIKNINGVTLLHYMAGMQLNKNNDDLFDMLLKKVDNVNVKSNNCFVPLEHAIIWNRKENALKLIGVGGNIDMLTPSSKEICKKWINEENVKVLISRKILRY